MFWDKFLVVNTGYRRDTVKWLVAGEFPPPRGTEVLFHCHNTESFVRATDRLDQYRRHVASPAGVSNDRGV